MNNLVVKTNFVAVDEDGRDYRIDLERVSDFEKGWVVVVSGTPGRWYLNSLEKVFEQGTERLSIDFGQDWWWANFSDVIGSVSFVARSINEVAIDRLR